MVQDHGDRLTAIDASFLHQEGENSHMHVGAVLVFDGTPPSYEDFCNHIRSRLHLVPRYRQKLSFPPFDAGRPIWVDDPNFNLEYHVRDTALPGPGSEEQLLNLAARIHSQQLDRSKPLWETWLVQGLEGGRFALISKNHHALIDGEAGVDLVSVLFDLEPNPPAIKNTGKPWTPSPEPTGAELLARSVVDFIKTPLEVANRALHATRNPAFALHTARDAVEGLSEIVWAGLNPAPETPLNVEIGPHRRLAFVRNELSDFKLIKNTFGGTVNDVVIAVAAGALREWLQTRSVRPEGLELRALVPVSIRGKDEHGTLGNRIAAMRGPLPVYIEDPVARLQAVREGMDGLKESKQAIGAEVLSSMQDLAPPTVLSQASRLQFSTRLFNLIVTNVPGPQIPLYLLGNELKDLFPVAFLAKDHALAIAIMSYNGKISFGVLGDYDAMPDLEEFGGFLDQAVAELVQAAKKQIASDEAAIKLPSTARTPKAAKANGKITQQS